MKKCLVCGYESGQDYCKKHSANKALVHRFRNMSDSDQDNSIDKRGYELRLLKKSKVYPQLSITEVIKIVEK